MGRSAFHRLMVGREGERERERETERDRDRERERERDREPTTDNRGELNL